MANDVENLVKRIRRVLDRTNGIHDSDLRSVIGKIMDETGWTLDACRESRSQEVSNEYTCEWCGADHSQESFETDNGEISLCRPCLLDRPPCIAANMDHFIGAIQCGTIPNGIRKMDGSIKLFAKGIYAVRTNEDDEVCIVKYGNLEELKISLEGGDESESWKTVQIWKDGKVLQVKRDVTFIE